MCQVWRIHLIPDADVSEDVAQYCIDHNIAAMGWSLRSKSDTERQSIKDDFNKFKAFAIEEYGGSSSFSSVIRFHDEVQVNDLIWTRVHGRYYLARVKQESKWEFIADNKTVNMDLSNQRLNIEWHLVSDCSDESTVPGAITTALIRGSTFQRIRKEGMAEYSMLLYNHVAKDGFKYDAKLTPDKGTFFNLLQPSDLEDILCMWLYKEQGYLCIPSTNKLSTQLYECVLFHPEKPGINVYIQVKKGQDHIDASQYKSLSGEKYLLTTEGTVANLDLNDNSIHVVDPEEIFAFCMDVKNQNYLPEKIRTWVGLLDSRKGIMFDTNKTFSDTNELEMLTQNKIAAYGDAKRYINSFHEGDYALFYSRGRGVVAVGRVKEDSSLSNGSEELYHNVDMLVPKQYDFINRPLCALSASEIGELLNHKFYYASTMKVPFLDEIEVQRVCDALQKKYNTK